MEDAGRAARQPARALARGEIGDRAGDELCAGERPAGAGRRPGSRPHLGLCAGRRLSQGGQEGAEGDGPLAGRRGSACELKVFVDTAPVMEKPLSAAAGIGWQGKHTNLLNREHGSWLFLGVIYTTLELEPDEPAEPTIAAAAPRCIDACPTGAITGPAPDRCAALHLLSDDRACRADPARISRGDRQPHLRLRRLPGGLPVEPLRQRPPRPTRPSRRGRSWSRRRWPICWRWTMRLSASCFRDRRSSGSGCDRMIRNCLIAAGNSGDPALRPAVERHLDERGSGRGRCGAMGDGAALARLDRGDAALRVDCRRPGNCGRRHG